MIRIPTIALVIAAVLMLVPAHADVAPGLNATLEDARTMALSLPGIPVRNRTARIGHFEMTVSQGTVFRLETKAGAALGLYVEGEGTWRYRSEDAGDREVFRTNAKRLAKPVADDGSLTSPFTKAIVLFTEPELSELTSETASDVTPTSSPGFEPLWRKYINTYEPLEHLLAEARLNGKGRWMYAEMMGSGDASGYTYDSVREGRESLVVLKKYSSYDLRISETISQQMLLGWSPGFEPWLRLDDARIEVATPDNRTGTIASTLKFHVKRLGARVLPLYLINNRDPEVYDWRSEKRKLNVKRVTDAAGNALPFSHRFHELLVEVPPVEGIESDVVLHLETDGDVFTDMNGRHDDNYFQLPRGVLYPIPMHWQGEHFTYAIKARTKKPWTPVVSGTQVYMKDDGDFFETESESDKPSHEVRVFGGKYVTREEKFDNLTVRVHAYAMARKNVLENLPHLANGMIRFYEQNLGPYPFDELDIIEVPEYGFGIAPSGMVLMTTDAYQPHRDDIAKYYSRGVNNRLAHEIAHQWFGHKIAPASTEENWLAESFAEYFAGLAMGASNAEDKNVVGFKQMFAAWRAEAKYCKDVGPIWNANMLGGERGDDDRYCLLYNRGPLVLHMLRTMMGNERFMSAMRTLAEQPAAATTTIDVVHTTSQVVGSDMSWFFDDWVKRSGWPEITVESRVEKAQNRQFALRGRLTQPAGSDFRRLLVPLVLDFGGGNNQVRVVTQDSPVKTFEFLLDAQPKSVKVDPFDNNLATYK